jgi:hypothetical protein
MSQCALQPVEGFFGLHIMAHWQPSSLQSLGISTLVCYASNRLLAARRNAAQFGGQNKRS